MTESILHKFAQNPQPVQSPAAAPASAPAPAPAPAPAAAPSAPAQPPTIDWNQAATDTSGGNVTTNANQLQGLTPHQTGRMQWDYSQAFANHPNPSASQLQTYFNPYQTPGGVSHHLGNTTGEYWHGPNGQLSNSGYGQTMNTVRGAQDIGLSAGLLNEAQRGLRYLGGNRLPPGIGTRALRGATPWLMYDTNPLDDQGGGWNALMAAGQGYRYGAPVVQHGLNGLRAGSGLAGRLNMGLQGARTGMQLGRPATALSGLSGAGGRLGAVNRVAGRVAAPIYLGADLINEGFNSYQRGMDMGANNPLSAVGMGFNARTNDTLDANGNIDGIGDYASQVWDNAGHPLQMLYAAPKGTMDTVGATAAAHAGNSRINSQMADTEQQMARNDQQVLEEEREQAAREDRPAPYNWRSDYRRVRVNDPDQSWGNAQIFGRRKVWRYRDRNNGNTYTVGQLPRRVRESIYR